MPVTCLCSVLDYLDFFPFERRTQQQPKGIFSLGEIWDVFQENILNGQRERKKEGEKKKKE